MQEITPASLLLNQTKLNQTKQNMKEYQYPELDVIAIPIHEGFAGSVGDESDDMKYDNGGDAW